MIGFGVLLGIVAAGLLVGWWGSRGTAPSPAASPSTQLPGSSPDARVPAMSADSNPPVEITAPAVAATNAPATTAATNLLAGWEDKLDEILGSDQDDTNKVKDLFAIFPRLPEEGQTEVAQHLSNLVPDDNYAGWGSCCRTPSCRIRCWTCS